MHLNVRAFNIFQSLIVVKKRKSITETKDIFPRRYELNAYQSTILDCLKFIKIYPVENCHHLGH